MNEEFLNSVKASVVINDDDRVIDHHVVNAAFSLIQANGDNKLSQPGNYRLLVTKTKKGKREQITETFDCEGISVGLGWGDGIDLRFEREYESSFDFEIEHIKYFNLMSVLHGVVLILTGVTKLKPSREYESDITLLFAPSDKFDQIINQVIGN